MNLIVSMVTPSIDSARIGADARLLKAVRKGSTTEVRKGLVSSLGVSVSFSSMRPQRTRRTHLPEGGGGAGAGVAEAAGAVVVVVGGRACSSSIARSLLSSAPVSSATFLPSRRKMKVGIALTLFSMANSGSSSTSTFLTSMENSAARDWKMGPMRWHGPHHEAVK